MLAGRFDGVDRLWARSNSQKSGVVFGLDQRWADSAVLLNRAHDPGAEGAR